MNGLLTLPWKVIVCNSFPLPLTSVENAGVARLLPPALATVAVICGQFTLATLRPRNVLLHVRRLGYEPLDKEVDLGTAAGLSNVLE